MLRSLNGRLTGVHKVLCCAAEIACKGRQDFHFGHDGGYMIPIHSKIGQGMRTYSDKLVNWHGRMLASMGRSCRENPCASARCSGLPGRMGNPAPNTGYEPNLANFSSCTDPEHTPIDISGSHQDFLSPDDVTMNPPVQTA